MFCINEILRVSFAGVGFNVTNSKPTLCLNDLIYQHNSSRNLSLDLFTVEHFIARVLTEFEGLVKKFQHTGANALLPVYLRHWLHQYVRSSPRENSNNSYRYLYSFQGSTGGSQDGNDGSTRLFITKRNHRRIG